jgi:phage terminase large subunit
MYGGAGSGKSHFAALKILDRILFEPVKHRILLVRKTFPSLRRSCYTLLKDYIYKWQLGELFKFNDSSLTITYTPNGNQIISVSVDDPEKVKSIERITAIWIEEPTELTEDEFRQINLRLRGDLGTYQQIMLTFNPIDVFSWLNNYFFKNPKEDTTIDHSTVYDNEFINQEYIDELESLKDQDQVFYDIYTLGEWGVLQNLVYTNYEALSVWNPSYYDEAIYGVDFGYNAPSVLLEIGVRDPHYYIREHIYQKGLTNQQFIDRCRAAIPNPDKAIIYCDAAEPDRVNEFIDAGFLHSTLAYKNPNSVNDGIDFCRRKKLHILEDSINTLKEIRAYKHKKDKTGRILEEPVNYMNHAMDPMRYAMYTHHRLHARKKLGVYIAYGAR